MIVYEVFEYRGVFDDKSLGLYAKRADAIKFASQLAHKNKWRKLDRKSWGVRDDYGMMEGLIVVKRKVE